MNKTLRYALIGAGGNAEKKHIQGYKNVLNVEVVAICDVVREKAAQMAERHGVEKVYTDYKEMIQTEQLDLVSIVTPNYLHAEIAIYALQYGVHVHCEKPLSMNAEEARSILRATEQSGSQLMIGLNNRFTNEAVLLKRWIDEDNLGHIYSAKAGWVRRSGIPGRGTWFTNRSLAGGGVMIDLGAHYLDLALYLMGKPEPSFIVGSTHQNFVHTTSRNRNGYKGVEGGIFNVEDSASGYLSLVNGASVAFDFSWASNIEQDRYYVELLGTKGGATLVNGELKLFGEYGGVCMDITPKLKLNPNLKLANEFQHFVDYITHNGQKLIAPAEDGLYLAEIIDAFYQSANEQSPVSFRHSMCVI
ncbi:putative dehydrogenase [Paenibacillus cellulosilyticus]|uniref:Putative dehydrogenase n=1 Tax=Paenibacillus cellulosilyticus TaxID=375489 RepID=A0A2V2YHC6_9BACL|nr:Gfo/Idh/MocA family oxidoreductase [Paenibacillus cellulosilyticus]PWV90592.1 putative dehydrogenase [Paenibacillus cellulosilyticus]QKS45243.1 Gfo/Idh/MocA family oxidoreductase [Paenibacillus cellulosilyticus]